MVRFEYKAYRRRFARRFSNAREDFPAREGLLVRIEDRDGRAGFGEAAPIESFGTESFVSALSAAAALDEKLDLETIRPHLRGYPSLLWAIESALAMIEREGSWPAIEKPWPICGLPSDLESWDEIGELIRCHYRCLKLKIGKRGFLQERRALDRIVEAGEGALSLRLDANGTLDARRAAEWLEAASELPVEYLEQPLPRGEERAMARLAADFPTPLALDESVSHVDDLKRWRDAQWPGVFIIKPSLSGSWTELAEELAAGPIDAVYSSALETKVGMACGLGFALRFGDRRRALGFGVSRLFGDENVGLELGPFLQTGDLPGIEDLQSLWNRI